MQTKHPLLALELMLDIIRRLRPVVATIERHDRDLARQIRRSASSTALNLGEGNAAHKGHRREKLNTAHQEVQEVRTALRTAEAWGYIKTSTQKELDCDLDRVAAMSFRLARS